MTDDLTFVDTNVLIYAYDRSASEKHAVARARLTDLWGSRNGVTSTQVLQEFYVNATRRLPRPLTAPNARRVIAHYATWPVHRIDPGDILEASALEQRHKLSFWDALVIVSASRLGAVRLLSEDLQHGQTIGGIRIENPFV
jgi:predicted nucleic acid-binding protein